MKEQFGRYQIKKYLAKGGMATIYLAFDDRFERDVIIKVLPRHFAHDPQFRQRFLREAKTVANLQHSAIVPVYDVGEEDEQSYLVMQYMEGGSLADRIEKGAMPLAEATAIIDRIGSALDFAHKQGVIHRDLKPGNILFDKYGQAYLADFGIAKINESVTNLTGSAIVGTPAYMSPEQVEAAGEIDGRSDLYNLGIILFEMVTGEIPFKADTPIQMLMQHVMQPPPRILSINSDLPPDLEQIVLVALAKKRNERFSTAKELSALLHKVIAGEPIGSIYKGDVADSNLVRETVLYPPISSGSKEVVGGRTAVIGNTHPTDLVGAKSKGLPAWLFALLGMMIVVGGIGFGWITGQKEEPTATTDPVALTEPAATDEVAVVVTIAETRATVSPTKTAVPLVTITATAIPVAETATAVPPTSTRRATNTAVPTNTSLPTNTPFPTFTPTPTGPWARIDQIQVVDGAYHVFYEPFNYTPQIPGTHLHFFFNTVTPEQAGVPNSGPWILYALPSPFTRYKVSDKPAAATELCLLVANSNHSIQLNTGNCVALP